MKASKIVHKDEVRIRVDFPFNQEIISKIKQIPDARWSNTHRVWHIPYNEEAYGLLINLLPDIEISDTEMGQLAKRHTIKIAEVISVKPENRITNDRNEIVIEVSNKCISLKMPKNETDIQFIRTFKFVRWDNNHFRWILPNYGKNLEMINNYFNTRISRIETRISEQLKAVPNFGSTLIVADLPKIDSKSLQEIEKFKQWMEQKRYSDSSVKIYTGAINVFLRFIKPKTSSEATNEDMQRFVYQYMIPRKLSFSYQNQAVNAAKLFFKTIKDSLLITEQLERPRSEHKLPNVLSKEEISALLKVLINVKHRAMLSLIYACGLRRSELLNLIPSDVDSKRNLLLIRQGKGRKDRIVPLSEKTINFLREYYKMYRPKTWLFEGRNSGEQYSERSLQMVLKHALKAAGINKPATLHWLRHSYATHLLESGTDLRFIQEILGHKSSKTTEIYTHVSTQSIKKIKSPFDDLAL